MKKKIIKCMITMACVALLTSPIAAFAASNLVGDINGNGTIDVSDRVALQAYIIDPSSTEIVQANADINADGKVSIADLLALTKILNTEIIGDIDGNGTVNVYDRVALQAYIIDSTKDIVQPNADINADGKISIGDLLALTKILNTGINGDIDGNGVVNKDDETLFQEYLINPTTVDIVQPNADLNADGKVNIGDFLALHKILLPQ